MEERPESRADAVELARAKAEYTAAMRELMALQQAARRTGGGSPALRRDLGVAEDRVARAAARLAGTTLGNGSGQ